MSIHQGRGIEKARRMGGYAGRPEAADLWKLSKRELVEGFDFSPVRAAVFELCFLDSGAIELAAALHAAFPKHAVLNAVYSGADVLFER